MEDPQHFFRCYERQRVEDDILPKSLGIRYPRPTLHLVCERLLDPVLFFSLLIYIYNTDTYIYVLPLPLV